MLMKEAITLPPMSTTSGPTANIDPPDDDDSSDLLGRDRSEDTSGNPRAKVRRRVETMPESQSNTSSKSLGEIM